MRTVLTAAVVTIAATAASAQRVGQVDAPAAQGAATVAPPVVTPAPPATLDHAINSKGTGGVNGRTLAPSPATQDHAMNTKGTGSNNGRTIAPPPPTAQEHAINCEGTGATANGRAAAPSPGETSAVDPRCPTPQ